MLSFICSGSGLALILSPLVLVRMYYWFISDIGAEPNPFPNPWRALFFGGAIAFVFSCLIAFPAVILIQWLVRKWRS
jgi:hypothetical protein